jgi:hypothetical protein
MAVADKLDIEQRRAPRTPGRLQRRMRGAHDPSRFRGGRLRARGDPQRQSGDAGGLRRQSQLAACDQIELWRLAPDFQHHGAERITGQRIGGSPQGGFDIGGAHRHQAARIEAELVKPAHRQRADFAFAKILPDPEQRPARRNPSRQACDESRRRGALPAGLGEHLMDSAHCKAALQRRIGLGMAKRDTARPQHIALRLDPLDAAAQSRKRAQACAAHDPTKCERFGDKIMRPLKIRARSDAKPVSTFADRARMRRFPFGGDGRHLIVREPGAGLIVHDMF